MRKAQVLILTVLSVVFLLAFLALIVQNMAMHVAIQLGTGTVSDISLGFALAIAGLLAGGAVLLKMGARMREMNQEQRSTGRELERKEVSREEAQAKVKVLENKVETLEKALQEALKTRT